MGHTALVLGDQLSHANPALDGADRVLIVESRAALVHPRYYDHANRRPPTADLAAPLEWGEDAPRAWPASAGCSTRACRRA